MTPNMIKSLSSIDSKLAQDRQGLAARRVLIFGPSPSNSQYYPVRMAIRDHLAANYETWQVSFPEDTYSLEQPLLDHEAALLRACDLCLVLEVSVGSVSEVAWFGREFHSRLAVICREQHMKGSFHSAVRDYVSIGTYPFTDDQCEAGKIPSIALEIALTALHLTDE